MSEQTKDDRYDLATLLANATKDWADVHAKQAGYEVAWTVISFFALRGAWVKVLADCKVERATGTPPQN